MKPDFALDLSPEGIQLLHRLKRGWELVGEASLDVLGLKRSLASLRETALQLEPDGFTTKLVLPESQVLFTSITCAERDDETRERAIRDALEGMTPYAVDDLRFDWEAEGDVLHVAVVAKETLEEAEAFALEHHFNPVSVVTRPGGGSFTGEPFFGETQAAPQFLKSGARVKRDLLPTLATATLVRPEASEPAALGEDATKRAPSIEGQEIQPESQPDPPQVNQDPPVAPTPAEPVESDEAEAALAKALGDLPEEPSEPRPVGERPTFSEKRRAENAETAASAGDAVEDVEAEPVEVVEAEDVGAEDNAGRDADPSAQPDPPTRDTDPEVSDDVTADATTADEVPLALVPSVTLGSLPPLDDTPRPEGEPADEVAPPEEIAAPLPDEAAERSLDPDREAAAASAEGDPMPDEAEMSSDDAPLTQTGDAEETAPASDETTADSETEVASAAEAGGSDRDEDAVAVQEITDDLPEAVAEATEVPEAVVEAKEAAETAADGGMEAAVGPETATEEPKAASDDGIAVGDDPSVTHDETAADDDHSAPDEDGLLQAVGSVPTAEGEANPGDMPAEDPPADVSDAETAKSHEPADAVADTESEAPAETLSKAGGTEEEPADSPEPAEAALLPAADEPTADPAATDAAQVEEVSREEAGDQEPREEANPGAELEDETESDEVSSAGPPRLGGAIRPVGVISGDLPPMGHDLPELSPAPHRPVHAPARSAAKTPPPPALQKVLSQSNPGADVSPPGKSGGLSVFGARKAGRARSPLTGLLLVAGLVAVLAAVALWSALFGFDTQGDAPPNLASVSDAPGGEAVITPQAPPAGDPTGGIAAPPAEQAGTDAASEADLAPLDQDTETAAVDTVDQAPETLLSTPEVVEGTGTPVSDEDLAVTYAASGIWPRAPEPPRPAREGRLNTAPITAVDPRLPDAATSRPPLTALPNYTAPQAQPLPPPPGVTFTLDERGLVVPDPDGAVTPEGTVVFLGRPDLVPPPREGTTAAVVPAATEDQAEATTGAPDEDIVDPGDDPLSGFRPRPRSTVAAPGDAAVDGGAALTTAAPDVTTDDPAPAAPPAATEAGAAATAPEADEAVAELPAEAPETDFDNSADTVVGSDPDLAGVRPLPRSETLAEGIDEALAAAVAEVETTPAIDLAGATEQAVAVTPVPPARPSDLANRARDRAQAAAVAAATDAAVRAIEPEAEAGSEPENRAAVAPPPPAAGPQIPTRASVANQATVENAIRLNRVNLIGVYGSASDRRALVRLPSGRYVKVQVGDRVDGGRVAAISDSELRYVKNGRNIVLRVAQGG